jgi:protocadherin alpha
MYTECTKPVDILLIIVGVIVGILAVGITLLFTWKAFVTIHDRREFARFEEEAKKARWDVVSFHD